MHRSSLNKQRPLPGIKSPPEEPKPSAGEPTDDVDGDKGLAAGAIATTKNDATTAAARKPQAAKETATNGYKLKDLPLEEVTGEVEMRLNRLKTYDRFSNSDCTDDLRYLSAATRCGSNPEVNRV